MKKNFVDTGKLPPVKDRLPKEPLVFKTDNMVDGTGVYGDLHPLRCATSSAASPRDGTTAPARRKAGSGIDIGLSECLTRTAPLFQVQAKDTEPLPNLAKELGMVSGRLQADDASCRRREMVGWRPVPPMTSCSIGKTKLSIPMFRRSAAASPSFR